MIFIISDQYYCRKINVPILYIYSRPTNCFYLNCDSICRIHVVGALYICYNRLCTNLDKIDMTVSYIKNGLAKPDFGQAKPNICIYGNPVELFVPFAPQYSAILAQNRGYKLCTNSYM